MASRIHRLIESLFNTDRFDGFVRTAVVSIFLLVCCVSFAAVGTVLVVAISKHEEPTEREWFQRVVGVDPSNFANIQHHTNQGIDYTHHFKFEFSDTADLDLIIRKHNMSRSAAVRSLNSDALPAWYQPDNVPPFPQGLKYEAGKRSAESCSM